MCVQSEVRARGFSALRRAACGAAAIAVMGAAGSALAVTNPPAATKAKNQFFDWYVNTTPSYQPSPFLVNGAGTSVKAFLESESSNTIRAVKIVKPIDNSTSNLVFNASQYHVSYVFGDLESPNAKSELQTLVNQVKFVNGQNNGTKTNSFNAFIGNFNWTRAGNDGTQPSGYNYPSSGDFSSAKLNMAMPALYPGSGAFRNPAAGNSTAPNIRSALFVLPIIHLTAAKVNAHSGEQVVPWIAPFNNWANLSMDSDRNPSNGYRFVPGQAMPAKFGLPAVSANDTKNQMVSQRDFATQVAHYRLRGADSYVAFEAGIVGYSNEQKRIDAKTGWNESHINSIFQASDYKLLEGKETGGDKDLNDDMTVDGKNKSDESSGSLFSGVYSLTLKKMDVLLTNMDDDDHSLTLPSKIAGFDVKTRTFSMDGGASLLVEYKLTNSGPGKGWSVALQQTPFLQITNNRNEVGVPEPTTITLAAMAAMIGVTRRRTRRGRKPAMATEAKSRPQGLIGGNMPSECFVL